MAFVPFRYVSRLMEAARLAAERQPRAPANQWENAIGNMPGITDGHRETLRGVLASLMDRRPPDERITREKLLPALEAEVPTYRSVILGGESREYDPNGNPLPTRTEVASRIQEENADELAAMLTARLEEAFDGDYRSRFDNANFGGEIFPFDPRSPRPVAEVDNGTLDLFDPTYRQAGLYYPDEPQRPLEYWVGHRSRYIPDEEAILEEAARRGISRDVARDGGQRASDFNYPVWARDIPGFSPGPYRTAREAEQALALARTLHRQAERTRFSATHTAHNAEQNARNELINRYIGNYTFADPSVQGVPYVDSNYTRKGGKDHFARGTKIVRNPLGGFDFTESHFGGQHALGDSEPFNKNLVHHSRGDNRQMEPEQVRAQFGAETQKPWKIRYFDEDQATVKQYERDWGFKRNITPLTHRAYPVPRSDAANPTWEFRERGNSNRRVEFPGTEEQVRNVLAQRTTSFDTVRGDKGENPRYPDLPAKDSEEWAAMSAQEDLAYAARDNADAMAWVTGLSQSKRNSRESNTRTLIYNPDSSTLQLEPGQFVTSNEAALLFDAVKKFPDSELSDEAFYRALQGSGRLPGNDIDPSTLARIGVLRAYLRDPGNAEVLKKMANTGLAAKIAPHQLPFYIGRKNAARLLKEPATEGRASYHILTANPQEWFSVAKHGDVVHYDIRRVRILESLLKKHKAKARLVDLGDDRDDVWAIQLNDKIRDEWRNRPIYYGIGGLGLAGAASERERRQRGRS